MAGSPSSPGGQSCSDVPEDVHPAECPETAGAVKRQRPLSDILRRVRRVWQKAIKLVEWSVKIPS